MGSNIVTPEFRVSYPNVFKSKRNDLNGKDEYSLVALFPKNADLSKLKAAVLKVITEKWGADKTKWPKPMRLPFRDQADREKEGVMPPGMEAGAVYINMKNSQKPGVVDENLQPIVDTTQFYAGCYAIASVRAFAYDQKVNQGVSLSLGNLKKTRDGDPFGNRTSPEQDFAPIGSNNSVNAATDATSIFG